MEQEKHVKDYLQIEDRAMKVAAMYFGQELLRTLGIKGEIRRAGPTEQVHLEVKDMSEDFNFVLRTGHGSTWNLRATA